MRKVILFATIFCISLQLISISSIVSASNPNLKQQIYPIVECNDGIDNDGDGGIDFAFDSECTSWVDESEKAGQPVEPDPEPQPEPETAPDTNPASSPRQLKSTASSDTSTVPQQITQLIQKYFWKPLGTVLGIETTPNSQQGLQEMFVVIFLTSLCFGSVILIIFALLWRENAQKR